MNASMGGRVGLSPPPPLGKNQRFFPYRGSSYSCGDLFAIFLLPFSISMGGGGALFGLAPPPNKNFCGRYAVVYWEISL